MHTSNFFKHVNLGNRDVGIVQIKEIHDYASNTQRLSEHGEGHAAVCDEAGDVAEEVIDGISMRAIDSLSRGEVCVARKSLHCNVPERRGGC
jgi:hypothetical protein